MYTIMEVPVPALYSFVGISYQQDRFTIKTNHVFKAEKLEFNLQSTMFIQITCAMVLVCLLLLCDEKNGGNFHLKEIGNVFR